jgi:hypothetical protein
MVLLVQFLLIIIDRILFLYKSVIAKLVLQYVLIVLYHVGLCFYLPQANNKPFSHSAALVVFYLIKSVYLYYSAMQVLFIEISFNIQHCR